MVRFFPPSENKDSGAHGGMPAVPAGGGGQRKLLSKGYQLGRHCSMNREGGEGISGRRDSRGKYTEVEHSSVWENGP